MPFLFDELLQQIDAQAKKIARRTGESVALLSGIMQAVAAGHLVATQAASQSAAPSVTAGAALDVGIVGVLTSPAAGPTAFTATNAGGSPIVVESSMTATYQNARIIFLSGGASGRRSSLKSIATVGAVTTITLNDTIKGVARGDTFAIFARPIGTDTTGAGTMQNTQVYAGVTAVAIPALSTAAVVSTAMQFRPAGLFTESHRGTVKLASQQGYSYSVTAQLLALFAGQAGADATTGALSLATAGEGFNAFAVYPPAFSNQIQFTVTPTASKPLADIVTLKWTIDGNDTAIDQDPTGAYPVYVGGLDPSGAIKTAQVDANGNWYVTPTSGTAPVEQGTPTDLSGSITTGGTSQQLAAAKTDRRWLLVQNPSDAAAQGISTAESLWVDWVNGEATDGTPSVELTPGATVTLDAGFVATGAVYIIAATTGHKFSAQEG